MPCYAADGGLVWSWTINNLYIIGLLVLFGNFYHANYLRKRSSSKDKASSRKAE